MRDFKPEEKELIINTPITILIQGGEIMNCIGCKELSQHCVWHGEGYFDEQFYCKKCKDSSVDFNYEKKLNTFQKVILVVCCLIHKYTRW